MCYVVKGLFYAVIFTLLAPKNYKVGRTFSFHVAHNQVHSVTLGTDFCFPANFYVL